ncbi:MAG: polysaccharide biosynthesis/export family protein [Thiomicrorhabdus sp.]|nr:polysaccharide biosynthesis/export family protein [Thiomicrorhabdus sp.]
MKKLIVALFLFFSTAVFAVDSVLDDGDMVRVSVYGNPDLMTEAKISASGMLSFPLIGEVKVGGLSAPETEQLIASRLVAEGFLKQAQVNVIVLQSSGQQVSVLGQVMKPGKYSIESGAKSLFDFIALSGGVSAKGSSVITILRMSENPPKRFSVNIDQLYLKSSVDVVKRSNIKMIAGDIVYVPEAPVFYVFGEANRPGVYRYKLGMTVAQSISAGGGISARGTVRGIEIDRRNEEGKLVKLSASLSSEILADDVIVIQERLF